ncbi:MAG: phenylacetate--CoA ligase [Oscillospiraceae bacterium]|nr:phenylacetate--CoA ligase [Oscillospiraceae bacterium]
MFFQKDIETMSRQEIEELQLKKLKHQVQYCMDNVPFYHERLTKAGVTADKIKCLSDVQYIPYTTKADIRDNYPYGLFAVPMKQIVRVHASSGTTGKPTVVGYTRHDLDIWSDTVARFCAAVGVTDEDIAQISFGYGLFTGALGLHYGLEKLGCSVIPISSGNTKKQAMILKDFGTTVLISTPSYAMYMSEVAHECGITNDDLKLRIGLFGSEGCTDALRDKIEKGFGLFSTDNYGMSELQGPGVSGECEYRCGLHFAEDHFLPESINSETGEDLPHGEKGELVITTLSKEGIPLLRYRTKDITRIHYEKCKCGRTHARMEKVQGRSDDMLKIRGVNVFPSQIESVMANIDGISPHYELILTRKNYTDYLEVRIEINDERLLENFGDLERKQKEAVDKLKTVLGIQAKVTLVAPRTIARYEGKAKRIIDKRNEAEA